MLGIIGGGRAEKLLESGALQGDRLGPMDTPFGKSAVLYRLKLAGREAIFLPRHGEKEYLLAAPFVNYRANIYALKDAGVDRILAWSGPGTINSRLKIGQFVVPNDVIDYTRSRESTFFKNTGWGFIRQDTPFCPTLARALVTVLAELKLPHSAEGIYLCTDGPRLETAAEIKMFQLTGAELIGMTLCPEVFLAKELEMCYASLCYVSNYAEGIRHRPSKPEDIFGGMATEEELEKFEQAANSIPNILNSIDGHYDHLEEVCTCRHAMERYKIEGIIGEDWHTWIKNDTES